jgi:hypothetical protein
MTTATIDFAWAQRYANDCAMIASRTHELDADTIDMLKYAANRLHGHPVTTRDYAVVCMAVEKAANALREHDLFMARMSDL